MSTSKLAAIKASSALFFTITIGAAGPATPICFARSLDLGSMAAIAERAAATDMTSRSQPSESTPTQPIDPAPTLAPTSDPWRIEITAWIWLPSMNGAINARDTQSDVDSSFRDTLEASDSLFAFSGRVEVGTGSWGAFIDGMFSKLGADNQSGPVGISSIDVTYRQVLTDFGLMYRLAEWKPSGAASKNARNARLDLYAGARYTSIDLELDPAALPSRSGSADWFDPIVGAKVELPIAEQWRLAVNGDIGGFGAGSDVTWSVTGLIGFDFHIGTTPASVYTGYRAIGQDYTEGSGSTRFTWDVVQHGPILGFSLLF